MIERRIVAVPISFEMMVNMVKDDYFVEHGIKNIKGVPADAQFVGSFTNELTLCGYLVFSHLSFARVPLNEEIPIIDIIHQSIYPDYPEHDK